MNWMYGSHSPPIARESITGRPVHWMSEISRCTFRSWHRCVAVWVLSSGVWFSEFLKQWKLNEWVYGAKGGECADRWCKNRWANSPTYGLHQIASPNWLVVGCDETRTWFVKEWFNIVGESVGRFPQYSIRITRHESDERFKWWCDWESCRSENHHGYSNNDGQTATSFGSLTHLGVRASLYWYPSHLANLNVGGKLHGNVVKPTKQSFLLNAIDNSSPAANDFQSLASINSFALTKCRPFDAVFPYDGFSPSPYTKAVRLSAKSKLIR